MKLFVWGAVLASTMLAGAPAMARDWDHHHRDHHHWHHHRVCEWRHHHRACFYR